MDTNGTLWTLATLKEEKRMSIAQGVEKRNHEK
jgi:hypothetical protein